MRCFRSSVTIFKVKENLPLLFRCQGSVVCVIWPQVLLGVLYSVGVVCFHEYSGYPIPNFSTTFITVLGLVIGLLLVFRTTTGYDRYYEGRKLWADITYRIRTLARYTWLGVNDNSSPHILIEKRTAINLLIAFAYATKNYLRQEYSYDEDNDIHSLTKHLPRIQQQKKDSQPTKDSLIDSTSTSESLQHQPEPNGKLTTETVSLNMTNALPEETPSPLRVTMSIRRRAKQKSSIQTYLGSRASVFQAHDLVTPTNIPMELVYYYQTYVYSLWSDQKLNKDTAIVMLSFSNELMNILAQMEKILRTPIPLAYSIHLHQSIWLYLFTLPFQMVNELRWLTVLGMTFACFAFLGILAIGWEIENPFGYDDNDLPLDEYCEVIKHEVEKFASYKFPRPETWIFSKANKPFGKQSTLSAVTLTNMDSKAFHKHFNNSFIISKLEDEHTETTEDYRHLKVNQSKG